MKFDFADGHVRVSGQPAEVEDFAKRWQTTLWSDWMTHPDDFARKQWERVIGCIRQGFVLISLTCPACQRAFFKTVKG